MNKAVFSKFLLSFIFIKLIDNYICKTVELRGMALSVNYFKDLYLLDPSPYGCGSRNSVLLWSMRSYLIIFFMYIVLKMIMIRLDTLKPLIQSWFPLYMINSKPK